MNEILTAVGGGGTPWAALGTGVAGAGVGFGAVREVCELILKAQGRWEELLKRYLV